MFEAESQQPGNFSLDVQDRMGGVQLLLQPSHFRLELVHLRTLGGLPTLTRSSESWRRYVNPCFMCRVIISMQTVETYSSAFSPSLHWICLSLS